MSVCFGLVQSIIIGECKDPPGENPSETEEKTATAMETSTENINIPDDSGDKDVKEQGTEETEAKTTNDTDTSETPKKEDEGGTPEESSAQSTETDSFADKETVDFKIIYNKNKYDVTFPLDDTFANLKPQIEKLTGVPAVMQKVVFKGRSKDEATLREFKVTKGSKIMVIGSTVNDVMSVSAPDPKVLKEEEKAAAAANKEPLSTLKPHKTILEKHGKPDDAIPGIKNKKERLPPAPLAGMYNKSGGKVRLTFKLEQDQVWIGTKERTEKIPMNSIKAVVSEAMDGNEGYHMLGIQLGPTEASRYWVYWVPAQYVDAIKDAILGKWQYF